MKHSIKICANFFRQKRLVIRKRNCNFKGQKHVLIPTGGHGGRAPKSTTQSYPGDFPKKIFRTVIVRRTRPSAARSKNEEFPPAKDHRISNSSPLFLWRKTCVSGFWSSSSSPSIRTRKMHVSWGGKTRGVAPWTILGPATASTCFTRCSIGYDTGENRPWMATPTYVPCK